MFKAEVQRVEDHLLVRQIVLGNTNAFRFIVLRYQKQLFRYLQNFGISAAQVEEIAQDVFLKAYKNLTTYDPDKSQFNIWLFVIAKNSALNAISKYSNKNEVLIDVESNVSDHSTPLSSLEHDVLKKNLSLSLNQLPVPFRNVITLFHLNELSIEEISNVENCHIGTVKSRLHRAKAMLKEIILKNYGSESL